MSGLNICIKNGKKAFLSGYKNFSVKRAGILTYPWPKLGARFEVDNDLTPLFPLINGGVDKAKYYAAPDRVQFVLEDVQCTLYSHEIIAAAFHDYDYAIVFCDRLVSFLNSLYERKETIKPDFKKIKPLSPFDIYKLLPRTNCRKCGFPSCLAFAAALSKSKTNIAKCPYFSEPITEKAVFPVLDKEGNLASTVELDISADRGRSIRQKQDPVMGIERSENSVLLTDREIQVLRLLSTGASNPEISSALSISPHTVKTHVSHIYDKLGVHDRAQAAVWASRHHLI